MSSIHVSWRSGPAGRTGRLRHAGRIENGRGVLIRPYRSFDGFALMYLYEGSGEYREENRVVPLRAGSVVYVTPGTPHWYGPVGSSGWNEVHLVFDGRLFTTLLESRLIDPARPVRSLTPVDYWLPRIDGFRTARPPRTRAGMDDEVCSLLRLLVEIDAATEENGGDQALNWLEESRRLLADNLADRLDMASVAAEVGMAYESWRKRFQSHTGVPPARYRLRRRVDAARELIRNSSLSGKEIAGIVGFSDEYHLSRQFHRVTGMTPTQFRRDP
ncbi:AraC family transcriptional regulator [Streptomyces triticagri]|uniref:AraC family transcriptional regulator n=1 Tax=Streptomyces triticagri TaxID=2293568 RepID=A0A372M3B0_9ACTN|nr:AraC family transcriptional regulator [Streptomyces triticagri]RFU85025.1 AraC family transcriptional regulator [Streptomyces triticagri]